MAFAAVRASLRALALFGLLSATGPASAISIELNDVAPDRIERQRAFAEGALPLPGTPNVSLLTDRLKQAGVTLASPMLIRVFKSESELEIWKLKGGAFFLFGTYPICQWSGTTGPKLKSGDKQAPEGFYTLTYPQLHHSGRWPKSFNLGFPNVYDQSLSRTGDSILVHGGCSSVGCYAMTNPVMDELHELASAAIGSGQDHISVHVYPFRMTAANMQAQINSPWAAFWGNLKEGFDAFEKTRRAQRVSVCDGRYIFEEAEKDVHSGPVAACNGNFALIKDQNRWLDNVPEPGDERPVAASLLAASSTAATIPVAPMFAMVAPQKLGGPEPAGALLSRPVFNCPIFLPSCRRYLAGQLKFAARRAAIFSKSSNRRTGLLPKPQG